MGTDTTTQDGIPQLPKGISAPAAGKWVELMDQLPLHVLRKVDVHQLRILCELLALFDVQATATASDPTDPKITRMMLQTAQQVHRLSACYGLTPADRARLQLPVETGPDPFAEYLEDAMDCYRNN